MTNKDTQFQKGVSGNPEERPRRVRNKFTLLAVWAMFVTPKIARYNRSFQNIPLDQTEDARSVGNTTE